MTAEDAAAAAVLRAILISLRKSLGLRQADLAAKLGRPQSFVSKYESGQRRLELLQVNAICKVLNVSLTELVIRLEVEMAQTS